MHVLVALTELRSVLAKVLDASPHDPPLFAFAARSRIVVMRTACPGSLSVRNCRSVPCSHGQLTGVPARTRRAGRGVSRVRPSRRADPCGPPVAVNCVECLLYRGGQRSAALCERRQRQAGHPVVRPPPPRGEGGRHLRGGSHQRLAPRTGTSRRARSSGPTVSTRPGWSPSLRRGLARTATSRSRWTRPAWWRFGTRRGGRGGLAGASLPLTASPQQPACQLADRDRR